MAGCCAQEKNFDGASQTYKRILLVIIAINGVMFGVEMVAGWLANSQALQADGQIVYARIIIAGEHGRIGKIVGQHVGGVLAPELLRVNDEGGHAE